MQKTAVIILAAGHGKRMESELPKALVPLHGRPLIQHVLSAVASSNMTNDPIIVVGKKKEQVIESLGKAYRYAVQHDQLGTADAVSSAKHLLTEGTTSVIVLYADQPFISSSTIIALETAREKMKAKIAMATVVLPNFIDWRSAFLSFSRVVRNSEGKITAVVEAKDATEEQKKILEVNPAYFCFDQEWLLQSLSKIDNKNAQGEYYLTDLVKLAFEEKLDIPSIFISAKEAIGTNSKEDILKAESLK